MVGTAAASGVWSSAGLMVTIWSTIVAPCMRWDKDEQSNEQR